MRLIGLLVVLASRVVAQQPTTDWIPTPFSESGNPVRLEVVVYRPDGPGPFPALLFNHGSTGRGNDTTLFRRTVIEPTIARFFTERGWLVAFPQRRGRGRSGGTYAEGLANGSGYTCDPPVSLAGLDRALQDVDQAVQYLKRRPDVDRARLLIGGQSRGGILSIAYAGTRRGQVLGVINFVGGWMSDQCPTHEAINTVTFRRGAAARVPTLWFYGDGDPYYRIATSRANFDAFTAAGGRGQWVQLNPPDGSNGHQIIRTVGLWAPAVEDFLTRIKPGQ